MTEQDDPGGETDVDGAAEPATAWVEVARLARHFGRRHWVAPVMVALGLAAAIADSLSVGLAVLLLFALLGQYDRIIEDGGLLAKIFDVVQSVLGSDPTTVAAAFFALILFNAALVYVYHLVTAHMMNRVAQWAREAVHRQYLTVSYRYLQKRELGHLMHVLATETWSVADAFYHVARVGVNICAIVIFGSALFLLSWVVGLVALVSAVGLFLGLRLLSRPIRRIGAKTLLANQVLAERMMVSLYGMRTVRVFAQEPYMLRVFGAESRKVRRLAVRGETIKALIGPIGEVGALATLILIALVASRAGVEAPTIIASVLLLFRLQPHIREIDASRLALAGLQASLRSVREMVDADKPRIQEGDGAFETMSGELRFENVSFRHDARRRMSLDAASFVVKRGEVTVLAGPSGSGKTTILNLILRLYDPDGGQILIDGRDVRSYSRKSWLARVSVAGQDVELVEGTVAQNLRIGAHNAELDAVRDVCALVEILEDIEALPDGFDTRIGNAGQSFSGGQRQRLGLARALLRQPEFLVLDEAMSAIEPDREARIFARIATRMRAGTVLVVSHRSEQTYAPDRVIRIAQGRIVDDGQGSPIASDLSDA